MTLTGACPASFALCLSRLNGARRASHLAGLSQIHNVFYDQERREENHMAEVEMPHWGHEEHLCFLENIGYLRVALEDYKQMVKGPKFICRQCGRVAGDKRNLCEPEKL